MRLADRLSDQDPRGVAGVARCVGAVGFPRLWFDHEMPGSRPMGKVESEHSLNQ